VNKRHEKKAGGGETYETGGKSEKALGVHESKNTRVGNSGVVRRLRLVKGEKGVTEQGGNSPLRSLVKRPVQNTLVSEQEKKKGG